MKRNLDMRIGSDAADIQGTSTASDENLSKYVFVSFSVAKTTCFQVVHYNTLPHAWNDDVTLLRTSRRFLRVPNSR